MPPSPLPAWAAGLPRGAVAPRFQVPALKPGKSMPFEYRWRAVTIARLYGHWGWSFGRIGRHFDFIPERARQITRAAGYYGKRGEMKRLNRRTWPKLPERPGYWRLRYDGRGLSDARWIPFDHSP
jgi:hypothetical protein